MFGKLIHGGIARQLVLKVAFGWIGGELAAIVKGERGPKLQAIYAWLKGKKTIIGGVLGAATAVLVSLHQDAYVPGIATAATGLVSIGLADKAWRATPSSWAQWTFFTFLRNHWADVVSIAGMATAALTSCGDGLVVAMAHLHLTCKVGIAVVTAVLSFTGWAIGEAGMAPAPREN